MIFPLIKSAASALWLVGFLLPIAYAHTQASSYIHLDELHGGWIDTVKQTQEYSCGPALVAALIGLTGFPTSEYDVLADSVMTEVGVSLAEFQRLLRDLGGRGEWYEGTWSNLVAHQTAIAAHFGGPIGHFVGVLSINEPYILLIDPSRGQLVLHQALFQDRWSGYYYAL